MKIGQKVVVTSFSDFVGTIEEIYDDGHVLVNLFPSFKKHVDNRSVLKICVPEKDLKLNDEWEDLWDQGSD